MQGEEPWKGVCFDDGTGRNVFYVDANGQVRNYSFPGDTTAPQCP